METDHYLLQKKLEEMRPIDLSKGRKAPQVPNKLAKDLNLVNNLKPDTRLIQKNKQVFNNYAPKRILLPKINMDIEPDLKI